jgi:hypothetical protein
MSRTAKLDAIAVATATLVALGGALEIIPERIEVSAHTIERIGIAADLIAGTLAARHAISRHRAKRRGVNT